MKTLLLAVFMASLAAAQTTTPQQFTGIRYGSDPCVSPVPDSETGCVYGGNIATDPAAARATLNDSTGTTFPCQTGGTPCINGRMTPPVVNLSGPWTGSMDWQNGMGLSGTVALASGTCYESGGPVSPTLAIYTVNCAGMDTAGQAASKSIKYASIRTTTRTGPSWQQLAIYYAYNQPSQWPQLAFYVPYPTPPTTNVVGGPGDTPSVVGGPGDAPVVGGPGDGPGR